MPATAPTVFRFLACGEYSGSGVCVRQAVGSALLLQQWSKCLSMHTATFMLSFDRGLRDSCQSALEALVCPSTPLSRVMFKEDDQRVQQWLSSYQRDSRTTTRIQWQQDHCKIFEAHNWRGERSLESLQCAVPDLKAISLGTLTPRELDIVYFHTLVKQASNSTLFKTQDDLLCVDLYHSLARTSRTPARTDVSPCVLPHSDLWCFNRTFATSRLATPHHPQQLVM